MIKHRYTLGQLADLLAVKCVGNTDTEVSGLATLSSAKKGQLSFLANPRYQQALLSTQASAVIVSPQMLESCPAQSLVSDNPYLTYAKASQLFADRPARDHGIHPSAIVSETAAIHPTASIGPHCTIGDHTVIGENTVIGPGCVIDHHSLLGADCVLQANVTLYYGVTVGDRVTIHSSAVLGSDGFGFAPSPDKDTGGWVKIAQLGGVQVGDDVEIGAGCTIDRGALDNTVIGNRVILDNQVQIAHNVEIGDNTAIAGCAAVAGSTRIGKNCTLAGGVGVVGHVTLVDNVHVTAMSMVTKSIAKAGSYSSGSPMLDTRAWRKSAVRFSQLDDIARRLAKIEKT